MDPHSNKNVLIRKLIGLPSEWISRKDDGGMIRLPNCHIWIECEGEHERDSLSKFGPITAKLLLGKARYIVWPPWRWMNLENLAKYSIFSYNQPFHSQVLTDTDVYLYEMEMKRAKRLAEQERIEQERLEKERIEKERIEEEIRKEEERQAKQKEDFIFNNNEPYKEQFTRDKFDQNTDSILNSSNEIAVNSEDKSDIDPPHINNTNKSDIEDCDNRLSGINIIHKESEEEEEEMHTDHAVHEEHNQNNEHTQ